MYGIYIDRSSSQSVTRQLCTQLRERIETGELAAGTRLLPTRVLAKEWGIARNVLIEVYEQLTAEGFLTGQVGSGTYVAEGLMPMTGGRRLPHRTENREEQAVSGRNPDIIDFATGLPDMDLFPKQVWAKYVRDAAFTANDTSGYGNIRGDLRLRTAISDFLYRTKGIICTAEQLVIVSGATEGMLLIAKALADRYRAVYVEDPTIGFTRSIFEMMGYKLAPVEVDRQGMKVDDLQIDPGHLILLTPSHQFPTGSLLSIQRRHRVIRLAEEADTFLIEDDYDSEFRLKGIPVPPLQTLCPDRVFYVSTFSKTLSPSLRIGFVIVPPSLDETVIATKERLNLYTPLLVQQALSHFITDGRLDKHLHTMKKVYKTRRILLEEQLRQAFGSDIAFLGDEAGMHLHVRFPEGRLSQLDWTSTLPYGFLVETTGEYRINKTAAPDGIVLGYGNLNEGRIKEGVRRMQRFTEGG